ncbi:MAG: 3' terminal RNA ribose 2'-O-methyltransferase Hen1 [Acidimicrobiales bacterium]
MLLTITSTTPPATDLGFLLHKNPGRLHDKDLSFGTARVCYPEATEGRCTAALIVDIDPVQLVRSRKCGSQGAGFALAQYVSDRPYAASSFLAVALNKMYGTALSGRSKERPDLADRALPFEAHLPVVPCRGGPALMRQVLEPLGYELGIRAVALDPAFPEWGDSRYVDLRLRGTVRLRDLLEHLFVLLPVFDDDKHYWVGDDEVDKLLRRGGEWLVGHPERDLITRRYLRHDRRLTREALSRLVEVDDRVGDPDAEQEADAAAEAAVEADVPVATGPASSASASDPGSESLSLNDQRVAAVVAALRAANARRIVDLGCGQGTLIGALLREPWVEHVVGVDVAWRALEVAARRLDLGTMSPRQRDRVELVQGALTYRDRRLGGFDAATAVEVVEHIDPVRLGAFERAVFGEAQPATVVVTTPNVEYNALFEGLPAGQLRHRDHRFEWTRAELAAWAAGVAQRYGYTVDFTPIGPVDDERGAPTQMAVFSR